MSEDRKSYDTQEFTTQHNARLTKDAKIVSAGDGKKPPFVKLTVALSSRKEGDETMWTDIIPRDFDADKAQYLKQGDKFGWRGKVNMRRYGENNEKVGFEVRGAELYIDVDLFMKLKERGFGSGKAPGAPAAKAAAPAKKTTRPVQEMPDLDDDLPF